MARNKAARSSYSYSRAKNVHCSEDTHIIPHDRAYALLGAIVAVSFGIMWCVGAWFGWM